MTKRGSRRRERWALLLGLLGLVAWLGATPRPLRAQAAEPDRAHQGPFDDGNWSGWRGLEKDGRLASTADYPVEWSQEKNVRWRVALPGQGYSSPIVHGDRVFVSTAYETVRGKSLKQATRFTIFLLLLLTVTIGQNVVAAYCREQARISRSGRLHLVAFEGATLLLGGFVLFGENVLSYSGTGDVRSWLSSGFGVSLCLAIAGIYALLTSRAKRLTGMVMAGFALLFVFSTPMPTRGLLFDGTLFRNPLSSETLVVFALPSVLLAAAAWLIVAKELGGGSAGGEGRAFPRNFWVLKATLLVLGLAAAFAASLAMRSSTYLEHHVAGQIDPTPVLGGWSVGVFVLLYLGASVFAATRREVSPRRGVALRFLFLSGLTGLGFLIFASANFLSVRTQLTRAILCLDRQSGEVQWLREGLSGPLGAMNTFNSPATPTPVTDGERVYAFFGASGLFATDMEGNLQWTHTDLPYENVYGAVVSPVVHDGVVVVVGDMPESPYLTALDAGSGRPLWHRERDNRGFGFNGVNRTPLVRQLEGRTVILVWGARYVTAYDLRSGEELWQRKARLGIADKVASLVADGPRLYLAGTKKVAMLDTASMTAGEEDFDWISERLVGPNCASPVLANGLLFMVSDWGVLTCLEAETGEKLWEHELEGEFYSSPVALGDRIYFSNTEGQTTVVAAEREFRILGESSLPEKMFASLAAASGDIFVRTDSHLYCFRRGPEG